MRANKRHGWMAAPVAAIAALALIGAGCGDSEDESSESSTDAESRAEFIAAADAICTDTATEVDVVVRKRFEGATAAPTNEDLVAFFTEVTLPALQTQFDEIAALPPPAGEEERVQAIVDAGNSAIAESEEDPQTLLVPQGSSTPFDEVSGLAQDFGLQVCGAADPDAS